MIARLLLEILPMTSRALERLPSLVLLVRLIVRTRLPLSPPTVSRSELVNETAPPFKMARPGALGSLTGVMVTFPVVVFTSKRARDPWRVVGSGVPPVLPPLRSALPPPPPQPMRMGSEARARYRRPQCRRDV